MSKTLNATKLEDPNACSSFESRVDLLLQQCRVQGRGRNFEIYFLSVLCIFQAPEGQHIIPESERISNAELKMRLDSGHAHVLLDVRAAHEYNISKLPNSINIPFSSLKGNLQIVEAAVNDSKQDESSVSPPPSPAIYVVCRRGNDSQRAVQLLRNEGYTTAVDVIGGLESWVKTVDADFPFY